MIVFTVVFGQIAKPQAARRQVGGFGCLPWRFGWGCERGHPEPDQQLYFRNDHPAGAVITQAPSIS